jgi:mannose-6-phosphate isomerase-like protein (cupin superfamily)
VADNEGAANRRIAYDQLCNTYRAVDDFRAKLLGFLPLVTGGGLVLLIGQQNEIREQFLKPVGLFGIAVTAGLLAYELFCIKKCHALLQAGGDMESRLDLPVGAGSKPAGQFLRRPNNLLWIINEPFAAAAIYPAVLAAWTYLAYYSDDPDRQPGVRPSVTVFVVGFLAILIYDQSLKNRGLVRRLWEALASLVHAKTNGSPHCDKALPAEPDAIAPDGSEVRVLCAANRGGMAHFRLDGGHTSNAVVHRTVDEIWYVVAGAGRMWRRSGVWEEELDLRPGISFTLPVGTCFQVRSHGVTPLEAIGITMPPWPGEHEAAIIDGRWAPTVSADGTGVR